MADLVAGEHHQEDRQRRGDQRGGGHAAELAQIKLEPKREHQEHHAKFGERLDGVFSADEFKQVRADEDAGDDVAQHDRLLEALEQHGHDAGGNHDHG